MRPGRTSRLLVGRALPFLLASMLLGAAIGACTADERASSPTPSAQVAATPMAGAAAVPVSPQVIGAAGGRVASADGGAVLEIPPGALKADVTVRISAGAPSSLPPGVLRNNEVKRLLRFEPDGTQFELPVRVSLRLPGPPAAAGGIQEAPVRLLASRSASGIELLANQDQTIDLATGEVRLSGEMTHFSEVWDNLFREFAVSVQYAGVPTQWQVGPPFVAEVTVNQAGSSPIGADPVHFVSAGKGAVGGFKAGRIGALVVNREQRIKGASEHTCLGSGAGEWVGVVNFVLLRESPGDPEGVPLRSTYFTSRARRAMTCLGPEPPPQATPGVALPGKYPTVLPRAFPTAIAGVEVLPAIEVIRSELRAPITTYSAAIKDPVVDMPRPPRSNSGADDPPDGYRIDAEGQYIYVLPLTYEWTMVSAERCGTPKVEWVQRGPSVTWSHDSRAPDSCPHEGTDHDVQVQLVVFKAESPRLVCILRGSETRVYGPEVCTEVPIDASGVPIRPR